MIFFCFYACKNNNQSLKENLTKNDNITDHISLDNITVKKDNITRIVKEKRDFLLKYINNEKNDINLKYLYYDYFELDEDDIKYIKDKLIKEIKNNWNKKFNNLYETVKIFSKIKN